MNTYLCIRALTLFVNNVCRPIAAWHLENIGSHFLVGVEHELSDF